MSLMQGRTYRPKRCVTCPAIFTPTGPRSTRCDGCRSATREQESAADAERRRVAAVLRRRREKAARPAPKPGYKPGTRQIPPKTESVNATGAAPWWASTDPDVWQRNQERMHGRQRSSADDIIGWRETGLSGGAGR